MAAVLEHELGQEVGAFSWSCEEGCDEVATLVAATADTDTGQYLLPCAAVDVAFEQSGDVSLDDGVRSSASPQSLDCGCSL
ncbi:MULTISPECIES: hypothetical protein [Micrococcaceae]|uniref:hypothetical protein n=1 Tax=Micrococcaceae TaxID=1268 RepID=UPI001CC73ED9|nr:MULTISPECIES: hypothetical protein [Micrococcaceae]